MLALWCRLVEVISIIPIFICPPMVKITVISGKIRGKIMAVATVVTSSMQQRGTRPLPAPSLSFHFCCFENGCRGAFPEKALSAILCDIPRYTRGSNWRCPAASYSWIGLPIRANKKQFASKPEGLRQFRDHCWKGLNEENSDLPGLFSCDHFLTS